MKRHTVLLFLLLFTSTLVVRCKRTIPGETPSPTTAPDVATPAGVPATNTPPADLGKPAYPPPVTELQLEKAYPMPEADSAYPGPKETLAPRKSGPPFFIDEPVLAGVIELGGRGTAGVPIRVVDVTTLGTELGSGVINGDGTYVIQLGVPLEAGHSIGLQIGDLSGTPFKYEDFIYSETYYDRPHVGVLLAMASVVEQ